MLIKSSGFYFRFIQSMVQLKNHLLFAMGSSRLFILIKATDTLKKAWK